MLIKSTNKFRQPSTRQAGLSLIELMISIVLGLIIIGAAIQTLMDTRQSYELGKNLTKSQESGRFALDLMVKQLRLAGYNDRAKNIGQQPQIVVFDSVCNGVTCSKDGPASSSATVELEVAEAVSDQVTVEFEVPAEEQSGSENRYLCNGSLASNSTNIYRTRFYIKNNNSVNTLMCQPYDSETDLPVDNAASLVDGVDAMQVSYGVKNSTGNIVFMNSISDPAQQERVVAIKVELLVSDAQPDTAGVLENQSRSYKLLNAPALTFTDNKKRLVYSTTVHINNKL